VGTGSACARTSKCQLHAHCVRRTSLGTLSSVWQIWTSILMSLQTWYLTDTKFGFCKRVARAYGRVSMVGSQRQQQAGGSIQAHLHFQLLLPLLRPPAHHVQANGPVLAVGEAEHIFLVREWCERGVSSQQRSLDASALERTSSRLVPSASVDSPKNSVLR
jgi:hypothetical protein